MGGHPFALFVGIPDRCGNAPRFAKCGKGLPPALSQKPRKDRPSALAKNARVGHPELWGFPKEAGPPVCRTNVRGAGASILNLQTSLNHMGAE